MRFLIVFVLIAVSIDSLTVDQSSINRYPKDVYDKSPIEVGVIDVGLGEDRCTRSEGLITSIKNYISNDNEMRTMILDGEDPKTPYYDSTLLQKKINKTEYDIGQQQLNLSILDDHIRRINYSWTDSLNGLIDIVAIPKFQRSKMLELDNAIRSVYTNNPTVLYLIILNLDWSNTENAFANMDLTMGINIYNGVFGATWTTLNSARQQIKSIISILGTDYFTSLPQELSQDDNRLNTLVNNITGKHIIYKEICSVIDHEETAIRNLKAELIAYEDEKKDAHKLRVEERKTNEAAIAAAKAATIVVNDAISIIDDADITPIVISNKKTYYKHRPAEIINSCIEKFKSIHGAETNNYMLLERVKVLQANLLNYYLPDASRRRLTVPQAPVITLTEQVSSTLDEKIKIATENIEEIRHNYNLYFNTEYTEDSTFRNKVEEKLKVFHNATHTAIKSVCDIAQTDKEMVESVLGNVLASNGVNGISSNGDTLVKRRQTEKDTYEGRCVNIDASITALNRAIQSLKSHSVVNPASKRRLLSHGLRSNRRLFDLSGENNVITSQISMIERSLENEQDLYKECRTTEKESEKEEKEHKELPKKIADILENIIQIYFRDFTAWNTENLEDIKSVHEQSENIINIINNDATEYNTGLRDYMDILTQSIRPFRAERLMQICKETRHMLDTRTTQYTDLREKLSKNMKEELAQNEKELTQNEKELAQNEEELAQNQKKLAQNKKKLAQNEKELAQNSTVYTSDREDMVSYRECLEEAIARLKKLGPSINQAQRRRTHTESMEKKMKDIEGQIISEKYRSIEEKDAEKKYVDACRNDLMKNEERKADEQYRFENLEASIERITEDNARIMKDRSADRATIQAKIEQLRNAPLHIRNFIIPSIRLRYNEDIQREQSYQMRQYMEKERDDTIRLWEKHYSWDPNNDHGCPATVEEIVNDDGISTEKNYLSYIAVVVFNRIKVEHGGGDELIPELKDRCIMNIPFLTKILAMSDVENDNMVEKLAEEKKKKEELEQEMEKSLSEEVEWHHKCDFYIKLETIRSNAQDNKTLALSEASVFFETCIDKSQSSNNHVRRLLVTPLPRAYEFKLGTIIENMEKLEEEVNKIKYYLEGNQTIKLTADDIFRVNCFNEIKQLDIGSDNIRNNIKSLREIIKDLKLKDITTNNNFVEKDKKLESLEVKLAETRNDLEKGCESTIGLPNNVESLKYNGAYFGYVKSIFDATAPVNTAEFLALEAPPPGEFAAGGGWAYVTDLIEDYYILDKIVDKLETRPFGVGEEDQLSESDMNDLVYKLNFKFDSSNGEIEIFRGVGGIFHYRGLIQRAEYYRQRSHEFLKKVDNLKDVLQDISSGSQQLISKYFNTLNWKGDFRTLLDSIETLYLDKNIHQETLSSDFNLFRSEYNEFKTTLEQIHDTKTDLETLKGMFSQANVEYKKNTNTKQADIKNEATGWNPQTSKHLLKLRNILPIYDEFYNIRHLNLAPNKQIILYATYLYLNMDDGTGIEDEIKELKKLYVEFETNQQQLIDTKKENAPSNDKCDFYIENHDERIDAMQKEKKALSEASKILSTVGGRRLQGITTRNELNGSGDVIEQLETKLKQFTVLRVNLDATEEKSRASYELEMSSALDLKPLKTLLDEYNANFDYVCDVQGAFILRETAASVESSFFMSVNRYIMVQTYLKQRIIAEFPAVKQLTPNEGSNTVQKYFDIGTDLYGMFTVWQIWSDQINSKFPKYQPPSDELLKVLVQYENGIKRRKKYLEVLTSVKMKLAKLPDKAAHSRRRLTSEANSSFDLSGIKTLLNVLVSDFNVLYTGLTGAEKSHKQDFEGYLQEHTKMMEDCDKTLAEHRLKLQSKKMEKKVLEENVGRLNKESENMLGKLQSFEPRVEKIKVQVQEVSSINTALREGYRDCQNRVVSFWSKNKENAVFICQNMNGDGQPFQNTNCKSLDDTADFALPLYNYYNKISDVSPTEGWPCIAPTYFELTWALADSDSHIVHSSNIADFLSQTQDINYIFLKDALASDYIDPWQKQMDVVGSELSHLEEQMDNDLQSLAEADERIVDWTIYDLTDNPNHQHKPLNLQRDKIIDSFNDMFEKFYSNPCHTREVIDGCWGDSLIAVRLQVLRRERSAAVEFLRPDGYTGNFNYVNIGIFDNTIIADRLREVVADLIVKIDHKIDEINWKQTMEPANYCWVSGPLSGELGEIPGKLKKGVDLHNNCQLTQEECNWLLSRRGKDPLNGRCILVGCIQRERCEESVNEIIGQSRSETLLYNRDWRRTIHQISNLGSSLGSLESAINERKISCEIKSEEMYREPLREIIWISHSGKATLKKILVMAEYQASEGEKSTEQVSYDHKEELEEDRGFLRGFDDHNHTQHSQFSEWMKIAQLFCSLLENVFVGTNEGEGLVILDYKKYDLDCTRIVQAPPFIYGIQHKY